MGGKKWMACANKAAKEKKKEKENNVFSKIPCTVNRCYLL